MEPSDHLKHAKVHADNLYNLVIELDKQLREAQAEASKYRSLYESLVGKHAPKTMSSGWSDTKTMTTDGTNLYLFLGSGLWKLFPDGSSKKINSENWENTLCAAYGDGYLYTAHSSGRIYKTSCAGDSSAQLLNADDWKASGAIVYYQGALIIFAGYCWQMNCHTGEYTKFLDGEWKGTKSAVVIGSFAFVAVTKLWKVDLEKKSYKSLNEDDWSETKALLEVKDRLYAAVNSMREIDQASGTYSKVSVSDDLDGEDSYTDLICAAAVHNGDVYGVWRKSGKIWKISGLREIL